MNYAPAAIKRNGHAFKRDGVSQYGPGDFEYDGLWEAQCGGWFDDERPAATLAAITCPKCAEIKGVPLPPTCPSCQSELVPPHDTRLTGLVCPSDLCEYGIRGNVIEVEKS